MLRARLATPRRAPGGAALRVVASPRVELAGARIDDVTMAEAIERIEDLVARRRPEYVVTPNVDHLVKLADDAQFRAVYEQAALVLADGMPLLWASRLLGTPLREKVSGSDLFVAFAEVAARRRYRLFFLGGREGAAARAAEVLAARHAGLEVCGVEAPPLGFDQDPAANRRVLEQVRAARPDVLFVGLGAPKQEKWIHRWRHDLGVPVSIGVGVSFEFVAGMVRRAPRWMQRAGLEWAWRLLMEPTRLWRRYLVDDPRFLLLLARQWREARRQPSAAAAQVERAGAGALDADAGTQPRSTTGQAPDSAETPERGRDAA